MPNLLCVRLATPDEEVVSELGPPENLAGTSNGTQFSRMARPDQQGNCPLFFEFNQTQEALKFHGMATSIPIRGNAQNCLLDLR